MTDWPHFLFFHKTYIYKAIYIIIIITIFFFLFFPFISTSVPAVLFMMQALGCMLQLPQWTQIVRLRFLTSFTLIVFTSSTYFQKPMDLIFLVLVFVY